MKFTGTIHASPNTEIQIEQAKEINPTIFQQININGTVGLRLKAAPDDDIAVREDTVYTFDLIPLIVPKGMYWISKLGQSETNDLLVNMPDRDTYTNLPIERRELLLLDEFRIEQQQATPTATYAAGMVQDMCREHYCRHSGHNGQAARAIAGRGVGGPGKQCAKATRVGLDGQSYMMGLYNFTEAYPYQDGFTSKQAILHHSLVATFGGTKPVPMVCMTLPNTAKVWVPVYGNFDEVDSALRTYVNGAEPEFVVSNLEMIDGPDIFIAECDFIPV